jgi:hypothetical protein
MYVLEVKLALSAQSNFTVAFATIYRSTFTGLERYLGLLTALGAYCREHLASGPVAVAIISVTLYFPCFAACGTALGLVNIAFRLEELLFLSAEGEGSPTIGALE